MNGTKLGTKIHIATSELLTYTLQGVNYYFFAIKELEFQIE